MTFKEEMMNLKVDEDDVPLFIQEVTQQPFANCIYSITLFNGVVLQGIDQYWVTTVTKKGRVFDLEKAERYIQHLRKDI